MTNAQLIGLCHILEDGITILESGKVPSSRRKYVLKELKDLLKAANQGSKLVHEQAWVIPPSERMAFDSFSFIDTYLDSYDRDQLDRSLLAAKHSIERAETKQKNPSTELVIALDFLKDLLQCIESDGHTILRTHPSDARIAAID
jgi:hypothetical protein